MACSAGSGHCFLPRKNLEYCKMCSVSLPVFSSLHEPISSFFPHFFHGWDAVQSGHACEELQLQVRRSEGLSADTCPRRAWDQGTQTLGCCFVCFFFSFFIGSSVTTNSSGNCSSFPVHCFLNHWLCKSIAKVDSQKCSEALGVKYCDKRRHSSSLLHCTF